MQTTPSKVASKRGKETLLSLKRDVESRFSEIAATRMAGVPVLNQAIEVEFCFGQSLTEGNVGILITPWFMSVIYFPYENVQYGSTGSVQRLLLPSGPLECLSAYDDVLGSYWTCSLFSPMFEFSSHQEAQNVAGEISALLLESESSDEVDEDALRFALLSEQPLPDIHEKAPEAEPEPLSRRELFRRFAPAGKENT
ncbi:[NiFe]-hydrogenase assembly chaperone HybE [Parasalinivibrio latis]|uniref:[NiFe]-hydrogenase assembly chaperone HybE n=1 Tax=Parasalinivibrio latis TaxID=2952610 RepID=UPI0030E09D6A